MPTEHKLSSKQRKRLRVFERDQIAKLSKKKRSRETFSDLNLAFGDELKHLLTTKPKHSIGKWSAPTEEQVARAVTLTFWRIIAYCRHDPKKVAIADEVGRNLESLNTALVGTKSALTSLHRDTRFLLRRKNSDATDILTALAKAVSKGQAMVSAVAEAYEAPAHQYDHRAAQSLLEFLTLLHLHTTGIYPATTKPTKAPVKASAKKQAKKYLHITVRRSAYEQSPALYRLIRRAVESVIAGSRASPTLAKTRAGRSRDQSEVITESMLKATVAYLRPQTAV